MNKSALGVILHLENRCFISRRRVCFSTHPAQLAFLISCPFFASPCKSSCVHVADLVLSGSVIKCRLVLIEWPCQAFCSQRGTWVMVSPGRMFCALSGHPGPGREIQRSFPAGAGAGVGAAGVSLLPRGSGGEAIRNPLDQLSTCRGSSPLSTPDRPGGGDCVLRGAAGLCSCSSVLVFPCPWVQPH